MIILHPSSIIKVPKHSNSALLFIVKVELLIICVIEFSSNVNVFPEVIIISFVTAIMLLYVLFDIIFSCKIVGYFKDV